MKLYDSYVHVNYETRQVAPIFTHMYMYNYGMKLDK